MCALGPAFVLVSPAPVCSFDPSAFDASVKTHRYNQERIATSNINTTKIP